MHYRSVWFYCFLKPTKPNYPEGLYAVYAHYSHLSKVSHISQVHRSIMCLKFLKLLTPFCIISATEYLSQIPILQTPSLNIWEKSSKHYFLWMTFPIISKIMSSTNIVTDIFVLTSRGRLTRSVTAKINTEHNYFVEYSQQKTF